jgi:hypothetical protein
MKHPVTANHAEKCGQYTFFIITENTAVTRIKQLISFQKGAKI